MQASDVTHMITWLWSMHMFDPWRFCLFNLTLSHHGRLPYLWLCLRKRPFYEYYGDYELTLVACNELSTGYVVHHRLWERGNAYRYQVQMTSTSPTVFITFDRYRWCITFPWFEECTHCVQWRWVAVEVKVLGKGTLSNHYTYRMLTGRVEHSCSRL